MSRDNNGFNTSKDISINGCGRFTDPNLSSIDHSYLNKPTEGTSSKMLKSTNENKENLNEYHNCENNKNNSYTFDSNQSMEMCSSAVQNQINFNGNNQSFQKMNNTGKFALGSVCKSVPSIDANGVKLPGLLSEHSKTTLEALNLVINDIYELNQSRWEDLRMKFLSTCNNFDNDEILNIMLDDEESNKYIPERMREILNEEWAAERETTIDKLMKQIGMLEMKNSMLSSQIDSNNSSTSDQNRIKVFQDLLDTKQEEIFELQKNID